MLPLRLRGVRRGDRAKLGIGAPFGGDTLKELKLPLMAAMSTAMLAGCSPSGGDHAALKVCVDRYYTRVDDRRCEDDDQRRAHGSGFAFYRWYYLPSGAGAPPIGVNPSRGSLSPAAPESSYSVASPAGESVSRGGFGASAGHGADSASAGHGGDSAAAGE
jgi:hypothetical protein